MSIKEDCEFCPLNGECLFQDNNESENCEVD